MGGDEDGFDEFVGDAGFEGLGNQGAGAGASVGLNAAVSGGLQVGTDGRNGGGEFDADGASEPAGAEGNGDAFSGFAVAEEDAQGFDGGRAEEGGFASGEDDEAANVAGEVGVGLEREDGVGTGERGFHGIMSWELKA